MERVQLAQSVRYLRDVMKLSFRQIAEELNISRGKCLRLYAAKSASFPERVSRLETHRALIAAWYQEHPSLKAIQVFERLRERQVNIGYSVVKDFTKEFRARRPTCFQTLHFSPGEEAQVDWFFLNHPQLGKLAGFAFILSYSRYFFAQFFSRYSFEFFVEGHHAAFAEIDGVPRSLRYDNLKSVVLTRAPLRYNPSFLEFARHYRFEIRLCTPRRANEKGRIERAIRSVRETFENVASGYQTLDALNKGLRAWCVKKNQTVHRSTGKTPNELKAQESLQPLPAAPWHNALILAPQRSSKTGLLPFDTNRYSIPDYLVGERLIVHAFCDRLEIFDLKGKKVATHQRSFSRQQTFINPLHRSWTRISAEAKRMRIHAVMKSLDPAIDRFLSLNEDIGEDSYASAYALFLLLRSHSRHTVISAAREAISRRMPRMNFIRSLLSVSLAQDDVEVFPRQQHLLNIDYQPRDLDEYE